MTTFELTGGVRIGRKNTSYPFVVLKADRNKLEVNASVMGNFVFQPTDISSIAIYTPVLGIRNGIQIHHKVQSYNSTIIFWTLKDPKWVIEQINATGFTKNIDGIPTTISKQITLKQQQGSFPIKKPFGLGIAALWLVLILVDVTRAIVAKDIPVGFGTGMLSAMGMMFCCGLLLLISSDFRRLVLKEGRDLDDIKRVTIFFMGIMAIILINLIIMVTFLF